MSQATQTTPTEAPAGRTAVPVSRPRFMFAFVVLYMLFLLDFSARLGVTSVFPAMQKALGLTDSQIGVAGSAVLCGMTLFVLPLSFIADKTSKKKAITPHVRPVGSRLSAVRARLELLPHSAWPVHGRPWATPAMLRCPYPC